MYWAKYFQTFCVSKYTKIKEKKVRYIQNFFSLTGFPKCHASNWYNISYSFSRTTLIWTGRSVVSIVTFIEFECFLSKDCNILLEFPAVLTWTTKKSFLLFRSVLIKLLPYLSLYPEELLLPSPIKLLSSLLFFNLVLISLSKLFFVGNSKVFLYALKESF